MSIRGEIASVHNDDEGAYIVVSIERGSMREAAVMYAKRVYIVEDSGADGITAPHRIQERLRSRIGLLEDKVGALQLGIDEVKQKLARFPSSIGALDCVVDLLERHVPASEAQSDAVSAVSNIVAWMRSGGEFPRRVSPIDDEIEVFPNHLAEKKGMQDGEPDLGDEEGPRV